MHVPILQIGNRGSEGGNHVHQVTRLGGVRIQARVCFIRDWQGWLPEVYVEPIWRKEKIWGDQEKWESHTPDPTP